VSEEVNVISRTQRIIVEPVTKSVAVINAGPPGPSGAAGQTGDPGEPGGTLLSAFWQYSNTAGTPPGSGQMRTNGPPITELYVHQTDTDGFNREVGLGTIADNSTILVRAANGTSMDLLVTDVPIDMGLWWKLPVSVATGTASKGSRTQLNFINPQFDELPTGGTTGQLLAKKTNVSGDVEWVDAPTGGGADFPDGGIAGDLLTKLSATNDHVGWVAPAPPAGGTGGWPLVVKATEPTAADYGEDEIPMNAVWIQSA
jgi:hypothetical protein